MRALARSTGALFDGILLTCGVDRKDVPWHRTDVHLLTEDIRQDLEPAITQAALVTPDADDQSLPAVGLGMRRFRTLQPCVEATVPRTRSAL